MVTAMYDYQPVTMFCLRENGDVRQEEKLTDGGFKGCIKNLDCWDWIV